ncbi:MAG: thioesterase family protein [Proteobacteria bacterium]|nr:thioesterase family protein [Pseudomonadota bacterium]
MAGVALYDTPLQADWLDYNGHLRDASYAVIASLAVDALMDRIGLDAGYRRRTGGTLYTLEMHLHFLHEVKAGDVVQVQLRLLGSDAKRIHADLELHSRDAACTAATVEYMLLHVTQGDAGVRSSPFPPQVVERLGELARASAHLASASAGSRRMALPPSRPAPA